jgi:uncharacterized protein (DUF1778 family)
MEADRSKLEALAERLRDEQRKLLLAAAEHSGLPHNKTLERVAQPELNISAIENTPAELKG